MANVSVAEVQAAIQVLKAVGEAIRDLTILNGGVPSGELYARLCGKLTLNEYTMIIDRLEQAELITVTNHYIRWVG